jgi:hypothetical protein
VGAIKQVFVRNYGEINDDQPRPFDDLQLLWANHVTILTVLYDFNFSKFIQYSTTLIYIYIRTNVRVATVIWPYL